MFVLYWDESDPNEPSSLKLRRALYNTFEEAKLQADYDLMCLRCRTDESGRQNIKSEPTGYEPGDTDKHCRDCKGTKICPSRNVLYIEELNDQKLSEFHMKSRGVPYPNFVHGKQVWKREE